MSTITQNCIKLWKPFFSLENKLNLTATSQNQLLELSTKERNKDKFGNTPTVASFQIKVKNEYPELVKIL